MNIGIRANRLPVMMVMSKEHGSATFPALSVKTYVTVVVPTGKKSPGAAVLLTRLTCPETSVAEGSV